MIRSLVLTAVVCLATAGFAQIPLGPEFQVNSYTTGSQFDPHLAMAGDGSVVVTWHAFGSPGDDDDSLSTQARRLGADGSPLGPDFQVNVTTAGAQLNPKVAVQSDGAFMVVWEDIPLFPSGGPVEVRGRLYDASGVPVGSEFQVNTYTTDTQWAPEIATLPDDRFVVVWLSNGSDGTDTLGSSVQARLFDASGDPLGSEFQVNNETNRSQYWPAVTAGPDNTFLVAWDGGTLSQSVEARRFDSGGVPLGPQFRVSGADGLEPTYVSVALGVDDGFIVTWADRGLGGATDIYARVFDADDAPLIGDFRLEDCCWGKHLHAAATPFGELVVVWTGGNQGAASDLKATFFDASGQATVERFVMNTYWVGTDPAIVFAPNGSAFAVWDSGMSSGSDNDSSSIQARRFLSESIFADGFESGDTSAWSSTVP